MVNRNFILIIFIFGFVGSVYSQVNIDSLTNKDGTTYEYSIGSAYYNGTLYTGGVEEYYSDTIIWSRKTYIEGEPNGYQIFYFKSGTPWCIGLTMNREKQGKWIYYRRNGEIQGVEVYKDGFQISEPIEIEEQPGD